MRKAARRYYWLADLYANNSYQGAMIRFVPTNIYGAGDDRYQGCSVRAVK